MKVFLLLVLALIAQSRGKIVIGKWAIQFDPTFADIKYEVKNEETMSIDSHCLADADDIILEVAAYSKVDGTYNPFVRPEPIHICKIHEHEGPLVQYMHEEINKFGNITKACPVKKGMNYYMHDFKIDEAKFPMPLPLGEFRFDVNASVVEGGKVIHQVSSEMFFKTVKE